jgi:N-acetylglutamate synthase-like GNAT family acetyltransferase
MMAIQQALRPDRANTMDVDAITALINSMAFSKDGGDLLPRSRESVIQAIPDFFVVHQGHELAGCVSLKTMGLGLAEVRSLAVDTQFQGHGVGRLLVEACVEEARERDLDTLFALTRRPAFFERFGFQQAEIVHFPKKVWQDCYVCPRFVECDEVAVVREIGPSADGD